MYDGPLPHANIVARLYLYAYMVELDDVHALEWPVGRLDAIHTWDDTLAYAILRRVVLPLAHLTTLEHGQPTGRTSALVHALRTFRVSANTPWVHAQELVAQYGMEAEALADVHVDTSVWGITAKAPVEPLGPRRTRSTARLQAAVEALNDEEEAEEDMSGRRRSRRAEAAAAKRRRADVVEHAHRVLRPAPAARDDAPPISLEAKIGCLASMCDALGFVRAPHESPLHKLVQPIVEHAAEDERHARQHLANVDEQNDAEKRALAQREPSRRSPKHAEWKGEMAELMRTHEHARLEALARLYMVQRRACARSGPLGQDADGRTYWHILPACEPSAARQAFATTFAGHWSHVLLIYSGGDAWHATGDPADISAILTYVERRSSAALCASLHGVRDYLAWLQSTAPST